MVQRRVTSFRLVENGSAFGSLDKAWLLQRVRFVVHASRAGSLVQSFVYDFRPGRKPPCLRRHPSSVKLGLHGGQVEVVRSPAIEPILEMFWIFAVDVFSGLDEVDHPLVSRRSTAVLGRCGSLPAQEPLFEGLFIGVNRDELDVVHPVVAVIIEVLAPLRDCFSGEVAVQLDLPRVRRCRAAVVFVGHEAGELLPSKAG